MWSVAFSPDSAILASASLDKTVILWNAKTRTRLGARLAGYKGTVLSVAFSPDGAALASAVKTVILWDAKMHEPLGEPLTGHTGIARGVAFSPDGATLVSASADGTVILWDVNPRSRMARACRLAGRNLSRDEWKKYIGPDVPYRYTCPDLPPGEGVTEANLAKSQSH